MTKQKKKPRVVCTANQINQKWAGIPGIEITPDGRLFIVFYSGGEREPDPKNTIYLLVSDDKGKTFNAPVVLAAPREGLRAYDPTLWLAPSGELWLVFNRSNRVTAEHGVYARICSEPDAELPAWGEEFRVGFDVPFSFRMNKPIGLSSGEWVMPVTHATHLTYDWFAGRSQRQGVGISRNQGKSWVLYGAVDAPHWALENMIIECVDGSLLMYIRTGDSVIWYSQSSDKGLTWSRGKPTTIQNPGSRFYIRRLPDGDWLLINSPDPAKRTGIVASLSSDEGRSWHGSLVLDDRDDVSYPDAAIAQDGTIFAVHDRDRAGAGEILLRVFNHDDIL